MADPALTDGVVRLREWHVDGVGSVSYWLAASARGRGAATRALRLLSGWAFHHLPVGELGLWTHAGNAASRRVAGRVGFRRRPELDKRRQVRADTWETVAYGLTRPVAATSGWRRPGPRAR